MFEDMSTEEFLKAVNDKELRCLIYENDLRDSMFYHEDEERFFKVTMASMVEDIWSDEPQLAYTSEDLDIEDMKTLAMNARLKVKHFYHYEDESQ